MQRLKRKIDSILEVPRVYNFATVTEDSKPWVRYVYGVGGKDGFIRFATCQSARKVQQIALNPNVHISCGVTNLQDIGRPFLQIQGTAVLDTTKEERHSFWNPMLDSVYQGPDDLNYAVVKVTPLCIELWNISEAMPRVWRKEM